MTLDTRALRLLTLISWSAFLFWLSTSGEVSRYLGPRTGWIAPAGAIVLALAAAGYAYTTRSGGDGLRPSFGETAGCVGLLLPILLASVLANTSLGAQAASKKLTARGVDVHALARLGDTPGAPPDFLAIRAAGTDSGLATERGIADDRRVTLTGFVSKGRSESGTFELSRFYITCCVADAIPVGVSVRAGTSRVIERDRWLTVTGALRRRGGRFEVDASDVRRIARPDDPYLAFAP